MKLSVNSLMCLAPDGCLLVQPNYNCFVKSDASLNELVLLNIGAGLVWSGDLIEAIIRARVALERENSQLVLVYPNQGHILEHIKWEWSKFPYVFTSVRSARQAFI